MLRGYVPFGWRLVAAAGWCAAAASPVAAHDGYRGLTSPAGEGCCSERDCEAVSLKRDTVSGGVEVVIDGERVPVDADTGGQVWSDRYDRPLEEFAAVQDELADRIAGSAGGLRDDTQRAAVEEARGKPTRSLEAYERWLEAAELRRRSEQEANAKALELLRRTLLLDPQSSSVGPTSPSPTPTRNGRGMATAGPTAGGSCARCSTRTPRPSPRKACAGSPSSTGSRP